ncbi:phage baseplate protein [Streptomyces kebangsaanensis]|uniref:phage baseplate protein n=1 Tax=Streptomyces kebangsaanensis TaxID=864058 RepID=UPI000AFFA421|nr:teichoic acid biosynthesis protein C [Streptomyces kebangsaanensis]
MSHDNSKHTSRRSLLAWGGAGALTAATVSLGSGTASAAAYPASGSALLVPSARLDLNSPAENWIREKATRGTTIIQAIGYDNVNRHIYLTQVTQGGLQLSGESAPVSAADRNKNGDLTVTKWDMAGNTLGYMYLRGFGHGASIGVEPVGSKAYLWTEVDSVTIEDKPGEFSSRGTRLARFPFVSGQVLNKTSSALTKYTPVPGSTRNGVSIDPVYGRLVVRYRDTDNVTKYQVHDLDLARLNNWTKPLAAISEPSLTAIPGWPITTYGKPFHQGFASVGRYLYMLHGNSYGSTQTINGQTVVISQTGQGNTFLSCLDLATGDFAPAAPSPWVNSVNPCHTKAAYTLEYREPEGLAVYVPDIDQPGVFSLGMGFASGASGARRASIYGKSVLIQP